MRYAYKRFKSYETLVQFANRASSVDWVLQHWQDVGGDNPTDIRAVFTQKWGKMYPFPEGA